MAKDIKFDIEARDGIKRGVDALANAVKVTLGPRGRNVIISKSFGAPQVTKDGVTVAKEIELEDALENMGYTLTFDSRTSGPLTAIWFDVEHGTMWGGASNYGEDYGIPTPEGREALEFLKTQENMVLENTYTGKTAAALLHDLQTGTLEGQTVLYWNTFNSHDFSNVIADIAFHDLPKEFHLYFSSNLL